jgi:hypothetical protein
LYLMGVYMRFIRYCVWLLSLLVLSITGCGGGGGGSTPDPPPTPTTKTAILKLATQNAANPAVLLGGFDLTLTLPSVASLQVDASTTPPTPLSSAVFSSGQFAGANYTPGSSYNSGSRQLIVIYGSSTSYALGEFITIVMTVPFSYAPSISDIVINEFVGSAPIDGNPVPGVTATILSFN